MKMKTIYQSASSLPLAAAVMMEMEFFISSIKGMNSSLKSRLFNLSSYLKIQNPSTNQTEPHLWMADMKGFQTLITA